MNYLVTEFGYEVFMLTANQGKHPIPYQLSTEVKMEDLNIRFHDQYNYKGIRRLYDRFKRLNRFKRLLKAKIKEFSPDIIVCVADGYHASIVKVKGSVPLVVEAHNNFSIFYQEQEFFHKVQSWLHRKSLHKVQAIVTLTNRDAEDWRRLYNGVWVIPNFIQTNISLKYSNYSNKRVIFVGRLEKQKRVFDMICIWEKVFLLFPDWRLDIYGDGTFFNEVESISIDKKINMIVHKPTDKIFDCYRESDMLVLTSEYEPFGLVIPEAMSCGLPVVSYRSPYGPESIITDGYDGFLVPLGDIDSFVKKMCLLMGNVNLRIELGRHAIVTSQRYSPEIIMPMWDELFTSLVRK